MPRFFKPVSGFYKSNATLRIDDDGNSHLVHTDGTETPQFHVDARKVSRPMWNLMELENLVKSGKWEEMPAPVTPTPVIETPAKTVRKVAEPKPETAPQA